MSVGQSPAHSTWSKALLVCGPCSSALYLVAIDALAALLCPDYHSYTARMVSELMAIGSPTRPILVPPMSAYNLLVFGFALGVWRAAQGRAAVRFTALALLGYGVASSTGLMFTPMDVRGPGGLTQRDVVHMAATAVQGLFIVSALLFGAFAHGPRFRAYTFVALGVSVVFSAMTVIDAAQEPTPWVGLLERVSIYVWMLWVGVLGASFLIPREKALRDAVYAAIRPASGG